ncbi:hypothetical protein [Arthrobacter sp. ov118]|uniref:hypothetical protein n=1 Tax=Arthrobacter sp. ov118 TaxID=1761747 RepID=UPI0008E6D559|nr:hypothetical protein SAMN04487915_111100 [Arthrobacter sp. ov118]
MTHELLSLSLCLAVVECSKRLMPFILCLAVLAKTGKTKGFQDIAAVFRSYFGGRSASNARSTVPRETPSCLASSLLEIFSVAYRWRICAQTSNVITFHNGQWPHFQLAYLALFSVGVNT